MKTIKKDTLLLILSILFIILTIIVYKYPVMELDLNVYYWIQEHFYSERNTNIIKWITFLGSSKCLIPANCLLYIVHEKKKFPLLTSIHLLVGLCNFRLIKEIIRRPRPGVVHLVKESGFSFPSGHTTCSGVFYGSLALYFHRNIKNQYIRICLEVIMIAIILLVGFSRIYLGVHYFSDVVGGLLLSSIIIKIIDDIQNDDF